jgi:phytoene synthase
MARATSFYYSFLVLPADQRRAIVAVWDFCRAVDDAVDESPADRGGRAAGRAAMVFWRRELAECFAGGNPTTSEARELRPFVERFALPRRLRGRD